MCQGKFQVKIDAGVTVLNLKAKNLNDGQHTPRTHDRVTPMSLKGTNPTGTLISDSDPQNCDRALLLFKQPLPMWHFVAVTRVRK